MVEFLDCLKNLLNNISQYQLVAFPLPDLYGMAHMGTAMWLWDEPTGSHRMKSKNVRH
jgi:hypothetical protein